MPAVVGLRCQAAMRQEFHDSVLARISISMRRGEITSELQLMSPCSCPAAAAIQSSSIAVGLLIVDSVPTMACKSLSALCIHLSNDSICTAVILSGSRWMWMHARVASLLLPRLVRGLSMARTAGMPMVETKLLAANWNWVGTSTQMVGPVPELKKLGFHIVRRLGAGLLGLPNENKAKHL